MPQPGTLPRLSAWRLIACLAAWAWLPFSAAGAEPPPAATPSAATPPAPAPVATPPTTPAPPLESPDETTEGVDPIRPLQPPVAVNGIRLTLPPTHGWRAGAGELHPYAGVALQYRSNAFFETTHTDPVTLELADLGLRFMLPAFAGPAGGEDAAAGNPDELEPPPWVVVDYGAQFQIFNRFHELNAINQHGLLAAHLRTAELGVDLTERLGTRQEPETAELAVLTRGDLHSFYHDFELGAFGSPAAADRAPAGEQVRLGVAANLDQRRYQGTKLNFAEYDSFGVHLGYENAAWTAPAGGDPLTFKVTIRGVSHPARKLNNFVLYQGVVKSGGQLSSGATEPWDVEFALGAAVIDVQTFRAGNGERRRDALLPVVAVQVDGDLNSKQYLHFRLRVAHEPDQSFGANYLRRTTIAGELLQRLNDAYEWEVRATQTWEDPSTGATLSQFELCAELRWYKEFQRVYLGRHAPLYLRVETRQVETVQRNVTGVKTFGDTRVTAGWSWVL